MVLQNIARVLIFVFLTSLLGCSGAVGPADWSEDERLINTLVSSLSDYAGTKEKFESCYSDGTAPGNKDRKRMESLFSEVKPETLQVDDTSATFTVLVQVFGADEGLETEWTAVKDGNGWKLKDTPLP